MHSVNKKLGENPIPRVEPGNWISIGSFYSHVNAVVCAVYNESSLGADLEVVYLEGNKACNTEVVWNEGVWQFKNSGPSGGYADNYPRLRKYVAILKDGRRYDE